MSGEDSQHKVNLETIDKQASHWFMRIQRGLTPTEQDDLFDWVAENPLHGERLNHYRRNWKRLDLMADWKPENADRPNPDLLESDTRKVISFWWSIPIAACLLLGLVFWSFFDSGSTMNQEVDLVFAEENRARLFDGSVVKGDENAIVYAEYTSNSRRLHMVQGKAFFDVVYDPGRPFIVEVNGIEVVAVGTAFNVSLEDDILRVIVSEGRVELRNVEGQVSVEESKDIQTNPVLERNQAATIQLKSERKDVALDSLSEDEAMSEITWQHGPLKLEGETLSFIVNEFNRLNLTKMVIADPSISDMSISGSFRSDNVEGFARILDLAFQVESTYVSEFDEYHLRAK